MAELVKDEASRKEIEYCEVKEPGVNNKVVVPKEDRNKSSESVVLGTLSTTTVGAEQEYKHNPLFDNTVSIISSDCVPTVAKTEVENKENTDMPGEGKKQELGGRMENIDSSPESSASCIYTGEEEKNISSDSKCTTILQDSSSPAPLKNTADGREKSDIGKSLKDLDPEDIDIALTVYGEAKKHGVGEIMGKVDKFPGSTSTGNYTRKGEEDISYQKCTSVLEESSLEQEKNVVSVSKYTSDFKESSLSTEPMNISGNRDKSNVDESVKRSTHQKDLEDCMKVSDSKALHITPSINVQDEKNEGEETMGNEGCPFGSAPSLSFTKKGDEVSVDNTVEVASQATSKVAKTTDKIKRKFDHLLNAPPKRSRTRTQLYQYPAEKPKKRDYSNLGWRR